jgi:hypothetical protein
MTSTTEPCLNLYETRFGLPGEFWMQDHLQPDEMIQLSTKTAKLDPRPSV